MNDDTITVAELAAQLARYEGQMIHNGAGLALAIMRGAKLARTDPLMSRVREELAGAAAEVETDPGALAKIQARTSKETRT